MEGRLFLISVWCGLYGQLLRGVLKTQRFLSQTRIAIIFNGLFWATGAALLGMLVSSYFERIDDIELYSILFAVVGSVLGAARGYKISQDDAGRDALLRDNLEWADTGFSAILLASFVMFFIVQAFKIPSGSMRMTFVEKDHLFVNKFVYGIPIPLSKKKILPFSQPLHIPFTKKSVTVFKKIEPGDIVIFRFPAKDRQSPHYGKDFIKRVIATEGQKVEVINKEVMVDGVKLVEPYAQHVDSDILPGLDEQIKKDFAELWIKGGYDSTYNRDNFGPIVVPPGHVMVMGDNRDRSYDSRFWGPLPVTEIKGKAWLLYWPATRIRFL